jgi:hypothetical protein
MVGVDLQACEIEGEEFKPIGDIPNGQADGAKHRADLSRGFSSISKTLCQVWSLLGRRKDRNDLRIGPSIGAGSR